MKDYALIASEQNTLLLKSFKVVGTKSVGDVKVTRYQHKTHPVKAELILVYGREQIINRPPVTGVEVNFRLSDKTADPAILKTIENECVAY